MKNKINVFIQNKCFMTGDEIWVIYEIGML